MTKPSKKPTKPQEDVKKYALSEEEKTGLKRLLTTLGFFNTAIQGLEYSLQINQAAIEKRVGVGEAPAGFKHQTRIDMETMELHVRTVKDEEAK